MPMMTWNIPADLHKRIMAAKKPLNKSLSDYLTEVLRERMDEEEKRKSFTKVGKK